MENQYTYYKPEPDDMNGMNEETPKPKKNRKVPKPVKLVCAGVAFGLVASATFQTGNYVGTKVFGTITTNGKTAKTAQTVWCETNNIIKQYRNFRYCNDCKECNAIYCIYYEYERSGSTEFLRRNTAAGEHKRRIWYYYRPDR